MFRYSMLVAMMDDIPPVGRIVRLGSLTPVAGQVQPPGTIFTEDALSCLPARTYRERRESSCR
jgi:hypothetical protein